MLDLTFNILAFFVMTYKEPMATKDFQINLPLSQKQLQQEAVADPAQASMQDALDPDEDLFGSITVNLSASADGGLAATRIEQRLVQGGVSKLASELRLLKATVDTDESRLEAITIVSPPRLKYRHLLPIVDACSLAGFNKINFAEATTE